MKLRAKPNILKAARKPKTNDFGTLRLTEPLFDKKMKQLEKRMTQDQEKTEKKINTSDTDTSESESESESDCFDPTPRNIPRRQTSCDKTKKAVFNGLDIIPIPTNKAQLKQRDIMEQGLIPKLGSITIINGAISSGKSNLLYNILANPQYYGKDGKNGAPFWDEIYLFTNSNDEIQDQFINDGIIPENHIKRLPKSKDLDKLIKAQKKIIKEANGDFSRIPILFVIFDDIIDNNEFIKSKAFETLFFRNRHLNCMTFILSQYFYAIPKKLRSQATNIICFAGNEQEEEMIIETYTPNTLNHKQFKKVIDFCWKPDKLGGTHPFIHICRKEKPDKRFRKTFQYLIDINKI